jgi:hypothetical protein
LATNWFPKNHCLKLIQTPGNQDRSQEHKFFPKKKNSLDLDARVELAQIIWGSCSSLDKTSICPSKNHRKTRTEQEIRGTGAHEQ